MRKITILTLGLWLFLGIGYAAPPTRQYTYTSGNVITASQNTANEDAIFTYLQAGVDTYKDGTIYNADIASTAGITYSKLSLADSILSSDIKNGEIVNADISASAAIAGSKISPAFGTQNLSFTGTYSQTNNVTTHGFQINQSTSLAASQYGFDIYSDVEQDNGNLFSIRQNHAGSGNVACRVINAGVGATWYIGVNGVLGTNQIGFETYSNVAQTESDLVRFVLDNASSTQSALALQNDGSGDTIIDNTGAKLTSVGVWTDAPSFASEKDDIQNLAISGYINKLKNLKMYSFQKKRETRGVKEDILVTTGVDLTPEELKHQEDGAKFSKGNKVYRRKGNKKYEIIGSKYPDNISTPNARHYIGYILDDASTPDELKAKDKDGNIIGISSADNTAFLLAVNKELIAKIETLEARIVALEAQTHTH